MKYIAALCLTLISLPALADEQDEDSTFETRVRIHAGVQLIEIPDTPDSFDAFYAEVNTQVSLREWPALYAALDLRAESLAGTYGADERSAWYAHLRPGFGVITPIVSNFSLYGEAKTAFTTQWFRLNGNMEEDSPVSYSTQLFEVGVTDRYRGAFWRVGVAWDGNEIEAARIPWQARGHVHVRDDLSDSNIAWGVNGRISPEYMSIGLSLRL